jgi:hypothetical protein
MWHLLQVTRHHLSLESLNQQLVDKINDFEQDSGKIIRIVNLDRDNDYVNVLIETGEQDVQ